MRRINRFHGLHSIIPIALLILAFFYCFSQVMLVMYGQKEYMSSYSITNPVQVVFPEDLIYPSDGISPNTADIETLCLLPGVGKVTANAFHQEIALNGLFHYPEDLLAVKGIGEKKLENIRPLIKLP